MPPPKGDSQERPKPRRLFSFDSIKSSHSSRQSASEHDLPQGARQELSHVLEDEEEQTEVPVHAPIPTKRSIFQNASEGSSTTSLGTEPKRKLEPVRPIALLASRSGSVDSTIATQSPTRARWENLRQHVLPSASRPMSPPQRPPSAQSTHQGIPPRTTTPKPSRLARLGFKQVVEQAREAVDETRKFGEEIKRACALARYPDSKGGVFAPGTGISSSSRMDYLRRPQSVSSVSLPSTSSASGSPSLRYLYQILIHHPGSNEETPQLGSSPSLPYESQVLATLLCPFLTPTKYPFTKIEEERTTAVEAFEILSKSWQPEDEAASVERCVWCTKAVAAMHPSPTRTRILGSLYRLLVPVDQNKILLTTQGFQSIASGLLLALVSLYRSSTGAIYANSGYDSGVLSPTSPFGFSPSNFKQPPHPDINLIQDLIPHFLSGSFGDIEDDRVEEVYGIEFGIHDRRHVAYVRRAVFLEALISTIENSRENGEWLICNVIEQYWPIPSFEIWTTLQAAIGCRKLNAFSRLSLALLAPFLPRNASTSSTPSSSMPTTPMQPTRMPSGSSSVVSLTPTSSYFQMKNVAVPSRIVNCLQSRVIPEAEALDGTDIELDPKVVLETRIVVVRVLLELICMDVVGEAHQQQTSSPMGDVFGTRAFDANELTDGIKPLIKWAIEKLAEWYRLGADSPWKEVLEKALRQIICDKWTSSIDILSVLLRYIPDDVKKPLFAFLIPILNDQLIEDPPPYPSTTLSALLTSLSRILPPLFYKPLFACSASDKEVIVVNHLCTLQAHSKYVSDYWLRDADMMSFALLGDAGGTPTPAPSSPPSSMQWGSVRLGQLILLVELIGKLQTARHLKDAAPPNGETAFIEAMRFATSLETRLTLMIEAKERAALIPPSQRMLLCVLFREIRLFTRSLKAAPWVTRSVEWLSIFFVDDYADDLEKKVTMDVERVQGLYTAAQEGIQQSNKRHTSILAANVAKIVSAQSSESLKTLDLAATFEEHKKLIDSLSNGYIPKALKLLVAISPLLSPQDYETLGPLLWEHCLLDNEDASLTASACFLLMQCAEKNPLDIQAGVEVDLQNSYDMTRLEAVRKISILVNWRFQILNQKFVSDRNHRPFKLARPPLPFVASDVGTSLYVQHESANGVKDKGDVPLELKRRLADLGWVEEDADAVDPLQELIKMPFSILPTNQLERLEVGITDIVAGAPGSPQPSPQPSPRKGRGQKDQPQQPEDLAALLRRNSTSGGPVSGVKRRAIFVPPLALIFPRLATLVLDPNFAVASAARATLLDLMRNDPGLLTRPIFDLLSGEHKDVGLAISTLTALLHVRQLLPPPMAHIVFNSLAGFLRTHAKTMDDPDCFKNFGLVAPIIANIAPHVSGMSIREIRRTKLEAFVIPSGALWFQTSAPKGPMFPRNIGTSNNPFDPVPPGLISISMIRVAQNMFFLSMLKRNSDDVHTLRKTLSPLVLPTLDQFDQYGPTKLLDLHDFIPHKRTIDPRPSSRNGTLEILSLMIARSHIPLVAQIFRSMPRHMSDRHELAILIDGLNRTLLEHGDDINIVSHVLIALMVASTRFRRLFTNGNGYALFMPALVKVYTEAPSHPGIRAAIEYSINRFYALHKESFLFQSISVIGQLSMSTIPESDKSWFSKGVYDLFHSLKRGVTASIDVGGIHNANKSQEREALMLHTAEEKPQTFLASIRRVESQAGTHVAVGLPDEFETKRLNMDDFVRMFLTVMAHDLTIARAQHFLRLLVYLTPHLYNASAATRAILSDGISALGLILTKTFAKSKGGESIPKAAPAQEEDVSFIPSELDPDEPSKDKKPRAQGDSTVLRLDYMRLVLSFGTSGGQITLPLACYVFDIARGLLKDWGEASTTVIASILSDFMKMLLHREEPALPKAIVAFLLNLAPLLEQHALTVDFTGVYDTILKLAETPNYANDPGFSKVVVEGLCRAALGVTDAQLANLPHRPVLISLFAESIFLRNVDIIGELERKPPTYTYLTSVILPLTLIMKTEAHVLSDGLRGEQHRSALASAWIRILFYVMAACQQSRKDETSTRHLRGLAGLRSRTQTEKGRQETAFWHSHLPTFMSALQVIKVVIVRASPEISSLPRVGIWERLAAFFRTMLDEGSAEFALVAEASSTTTTPAGSPRSSGQFDLPSSTSRNFSSRTSDLNSSPSLGAELNLNRAAALPFNRPRIVDYSLWSVLEFVCAYRSPLRMHLKLFTIEKVIALDQDLQSLAHGSPQLGGLSPVSPSRASRRVSTSIFSKARQRSSMSPTPSPASSPYLAPSSPVEIISSPSFLEIPARRPGYQISPVSPRERPFGLPKIVHLGPASPSAFHPMTSPLIGVGAGGGGGGLARLGKGDGAGAEQGGQQKAARVTRIKSARLAQDTYRRIRGVQTFMGYDLLLPVPGGGGAGLVGSPNAQGGGGRAAAANEEDESVLETWSRAEALGAILRETKDLVEEFEETFAVEEESVLVDLDQSTASVAS